uniref:Uncharacterized protein n=1 Tax=Arundo donax TaxID=35708 RepID=A0A0A9B2B3_ARUDO
MRVFVDIWELTRLSLWNAGTTRKLGNCSKKKQQS